MVYARPKTKTTKTKNPSTFVAEKAFNWGVRAGLNAVTPSYYDILYNNESATNQSVFNKVGYSVGIFSRVNLASFFLQPEASYHSSAGKLSYFLEEIQGYENMNIQIKSQYISVAVLTGYNVVKEGPYLFNLLIGPEAKYKFKTTYKTNYNSYFIDENAHYKLSMITGISANIDKLYFDFRVSIEFNSSTLNFNKVEEAPVYLKGVSFKENINTLNFSCGIMF